MYRVLESMPVRQEWQPHGPARTTPGVHRKFGQGAGAHGLDVDALIDTYFDTTIKIFGGLVLSDDLKKISGLVHQWYTIKGSIIKANRTNNLLVLDRDAPKAKGKDTAKVDSKIDISNKKIEDADCNINLDI